MKVVWPPKIPKNFPLTVTSRGYTKRIAGRLHWICGKKSPADALKAYHRKAAALLGGATPVVANLAPQGVVTIHYIFGRYLLDRRRDVVTGALQPGTYTEYRLSGRRIDPIAGHVPTNQWSPDATRNLYEQLADRHGADFARRAMSHFRTACRTAAEHEWCAPLRLGVNVIARLTREPHAQMKWRLYTPHELRVILGAVDSRITESHATYRHSWVQLRAAIYLALNGGFGAKECADLPKRSIDLDAEYLSWDRGKTGAEHQVWLWPETIAALAPVLAMRPDDELLFRTRAGNPWCYQKIVFENGHPDRKLNQDHFNERFADLTEPLGLKFPGQGFYKLKHVASGIADEAGDPHATFTLYGHALPGAKGHYVKVSPDRVRKVVEYVRQRLLLIPTTAG